MGGGGGLSMGNAWRGQVRRQSIVSFNHEGTRMKVSLARRDVACLVRSGKKRWTARELPFLTKQASPAAWRIAKEEVGSER